MIAQFLSIMMNYYELLWLIMNCGPNKTNVVAQ